MDFKDEIKKTGEKFIKNKDRVMVEEGTKTSFVLPFIRILGYDVEDPSEVVPEFTTDIGMKKGEKVDYAICRNNKPIIIIECKHHKEKLDTHKTQLERYFHVTEAKFAILTNGQTYRFYTDLVATNKMDEQPFLEIDITDFKEVSCNELAKFQKDKFNSEEILAEIKANKINIDYTNHLTEIIKDELNQPSDDFVNFFISKLPIDVTDKKVIEKFSPILKEILQNVINKMLVIPIKNEIIIEKEEKITPKLSDYTNNIADDNIVKNDISDDTKIDNLQSTKTLVKVTFPDKTVVFERDTTKTYVKVLQMIGLDKVKTLGIVISGVPIIDDKKHEKYFQYKVSSEVFIMTNMNTANKIKYLKSISDSLDLGLIVEKIG